MKFYQYYTLSSNGDYNGFRPIYINDVNRGNSYQDHSRNTTSNPSWSGNAIATSNGNITIKLIYTEGEKTTDSNAHMTHLDFSGLYVQKLSLTLTIS